MIDYDKLNIAHKLGHLLSTQTGMRVDISLVFMDEDVPGYLFIDYRSDQTHLYEQIDLLINELTELTQPKSKYEIGQNVWYIDLPVNEIHCAKILTIRGDDYIVDGSKNGTKDEFEEYEL